MAKKSARRRAYLAAEPATPQQLDEAIRGLETYFNPHSSIWTEPVPVWLGLAFMDANKHFGVLLKEYRRLRSEVIKLRNTSRRALDMWMDERQLARKTCRKRLQPIVRFLMDV